MTLLVLVKCPSKQNLGGARQKQDKKVSRNRELIYQRKFGIWSGPSRLKLFKMCDSDKIFDLYLLKFDTLLARSRVLSSFQWPGKYFLYLSTQIRNRTRHSFRQVFPRCKFADQKLIIRQFSPENKPPKYYLITSLDCKQFFISTLSSSFEFQSPRLHP